MFRLLQPFSVLRFRPIPMFATWILPFGDHRLDALGAILFVKRASGRDAAGEVGTVSHLGAEKRDRSVTLRLSSEVDHPAPVVNVFGSNRARKYWSRRGKWILFQQQLRFLRVA